ncbi:MAG: phage terminase large subunit family protein [Acidobacteria bacterium]|nr:phage terminase large subunit family protein [Acidobacteriota bacterium]
MGRYSAAALKAVQTGVELAIPDEMSTPAWAETYRFVDRGSRKGKWSNETVPFVTEIMACADDPSVREIVYQKPVQAAGSEVINNICGKRIQQAPTEMAYIAEKEDKAKAWTMESFDTMVRATPSLRGLIADNPEDNNQRVKRFPGGSLHILWATSPAELSSRPLQIIFFDEKAAYKPTKEGDPVKLGQARQTTYDGEQLSVFISTPRRCDCTTETDDCGDISHDYERGDQREFYVPCPHCDEFQTLKFGGKDTSYGLKWDPETPETPFYLCEHCGAMIEEFDRDDMLAKGYWRSSKEFNGVASFKINQLYSPFVSWGRMVTDWLEACKSAPKLEVFTNTVLGEVWKPVERLDYEDIAWNVENYEAQVPPGVLWLTAGIDIQKDRIECEVVGWGKGHESWSIDYRVFLGETGFDVAEAEDADADADIEPLTSVWDDLAEYLSGSFKGVGTQTFRIQAACIDSGYLSTRVYQFCKKYATKRWWAVKGGSDPFRPALSKPTKTTRGPRVTLFTLGTNAIKDEVFAALKRLPDPDGGPTPGFCHFPNVSPYTDEAHMKQLASEKMVTHTRGGRTYRVYEKIGPNVRNEALDVRCYATAARMLRPPNYEALARRRLQHIEAADAPVVKDSFTTDDTDPTPPQNKPSNVVPLKRPTIKTKGGFDNFDL